MLETSSATSPSGMLIIHPARGEEEDGECDAPPEGTKHTVASLGLPGPWSVCRVNRAGEILRHWQMPTTPAILRKAMAPSRQDLGLRIAHTYKPYFFS